MAKVLKNNKLHDITQVKQLSDLAEAALLGWKISMKLSDALLNSLDQGGHVQLQDGHLVAERLTTTMLLLE